MLIEVVKRYIESCLNQNMLLQDISKNLAIDIYGIELDNQLYNSCLKRLNQISEEYHIPPVNWHLYNTNALTWESDVKFDLVIGNPPYITYKDIDLDSRTQIKQSFSSCAAGKFDYCYAFIESGIKLLSASGKLVQLVPSNIYKNVFAEELRMLLNPYISVIFEYPSKNIFAGALTSTSIFLYDKCTQEEYVQYQNITENKKLQIPRTSLSGKWMFANISPRKKKVVRFGDVFNASIVVIATDQIKHDHKRARDMHAYIYQNGGPYKVEFMEAYNGKCAYCGASIKILPKSMFEIDHFIYEKAPVFNGSKAAAGYIENLVLACHSCNHQKSSFIIEDTDRQYLYPDTEGIQKAFIRDDQYYIKISKECNENGVVKDFYKQLNLGGEIHRLDYLLMNMIGMNSKIVDKPEASQKIGQAIEMLRAKRNIMG